MTNFKQKTLTVLLVGVLVVSAHVCEAGPPVKVGAPVTGALQNIDSSMLAQGIEGTDFIFRTPLNIRNLAKINAYLESVGKPRITEVRVLCRIYDGASSKVGEGQFTANAPESNNISTTVSVGVNYDEGHDGDLNPARRYGCSVWFKMGGSFMSPQILETQAYQNHEQNIVESHDYPSGDIP